MRRVVVTGMGIVSSIGNSQTEVLSSLRKGDSGVSFSKELKNSGARSHVWGKVSIASQQLPCRRFIRFMNDASVYAFLSMQQTIRDTKLPCSMISNERTGLVVGSSIVCSDAHSKKFALQERSRQNSPYAAIQSMSSGISACLSTFFEIRGVSYSISSACATSTHCIGHAVELIQSGKQDLVFAGGGEALSCEIVRKFDAMKALSTQYNHIPRKASRAYDANRDGFVVSEGAGIVLLEALRHALKRNARIHCEVVGYGSSSDGWNMTIPSGCGAMRCMKTAMETTVGGIDYINTHGTSTVEGDLRELRAIRQVFGDNIPCVSSTKSMTGHALGASGVHEAIYTILMMKNNFIAPSINIDVLDPMARRMNVIQTYTPKTFDAAMVNSFGFGGTNAVLVLKRFDER